MGPYTLGSAVARSRLSWDDHALDEDDLQVKEDCQVSMVTMVLHRSTGRNAFNRGTAMKLL